MSDELSPPPIGKFILDACCGGRMMWFDKHHPNALYIDIRDEEKGFIEGKPGYSVKPDMVMDFRSLKFSDKSFKLVVWDPPHFLSNRVGKKSLFKEVFGCLNSETWQRDISMGFKECFRVLDDYGILLFKWSDKNIPYKKILEVIPTNPLFFNISGGSKNKINAGSSYWFCFMKIPEVKNVSM